MLNRKFSSFEYFLTLVILILFGCKATKNSIYGTYKSELEPNWSIVKLREDNRFEYHIHQDVQGYVEVEGVWDFNGDTVNLNYKNLPVKVNKGSLAIDYLNGRNADSCFIQFLDQNNNPLLGRIVYVNDQEKFIVNLEGKVFYEPTFIKSISFKELEEDNPLEIEVDKFLEVDSKITVKSTERRALIYEMLPEKLLVDKKGLLFYKDGEVDKRYPYIKQRK